MVFTLAALTLALLQQGSQPATVPMREEPYHHLVFENRHVAVYDVVFPIGAVMHYHEHPANHLAIVVDSGRMRNEVVGAPARVNPSGAAGTIVYLIGETTVRFVAVEVLTPLHTRGPAPGPGGGAVRRAGPDSLPGCRVAMEAADVRAWRCRLEPGAGALPHPGAGPFLRVALSRGRLEQGATSGPPRGVDLVPGMAAWHERRPAGMAKNAGTSTLEFVDLEWK